MRVLEDQMARAGSQIDAIMLVGGFSGSEYLFQRVRVCLPRL